MFRRGEPVPFAFIAEADRFRSNVAPPPRPRRSLGEAAGSALLGVTIVAGLVGSVLIGVPSLDPGSPDQGRGPSATAENSR